MAAGKAAAISSSMERYQLVPGKRLRVRARSEMLHKASKKVLLPYAVAASARAKELEAARKFSTEAEAAFRSALSSWKSAAQAYSNTMKAAKRDLRFVKQYMNSDNNTTESSAESLDLEEEEDELQLENVELMISNARNTSQILSWARNHDDDVAISTGLLEKDEISGSGSSPDSTMDMGFSAIDKNAIAVAPVGWKVRGANRADGQQSHIVSSGMAKIPKLSQRVPLVGAEIYNGHIEEKKKLMSKAAADREEREFKPATIVNSIDHWPTQYLGGFAAGPESSYDTAVRDF
jgi:hypothetical protein